MSARSVAIGLALTVSFLGTACSSTRTTAGYRLARGC